MMRRYEVRSTMMTSNRPLEDWGKRVGDAEGDQGGSPKAATAILDRFLHQASVTTITGKSYRLRNQGHQGKTGNVNTGKTKRGDGSCQE